MKKYLILVATFITSLVSMQVSAQDCATLTPCAPGNYYVPATNADACVYCVPEIANRFYVSGMLGANFAHAHKKIDAKFNTGFLGAVAVGHQFNKNFRAELEFAYRNSHFAKTFKFEDSKTHLKGNLKTLSYMANAYYDFDFGTWYTPYVGAGIGFANPSLKASCKVSNDSELCGRYKFESTGLAWQAMAGVHTDALIENVTVGVEYRYFAYNSNIKQQSIGLTARYNF